MKRTGHGSNASDNPGTSKTKFQSFNANALLPKNSHGASGMPQRGYSSGGGGLQVLGRSSVGRTTTAAPLPLNLPSIKRETTSGVGTASTSTWGSRPIANGVAATTNSANLRPGQSQGPADKGVTKTNLTVTSGSSGNESAQPTNAWTGKNLHAQTNASKSEIDQSEVTSTDTKRRQPLAAPDALDESLVSFPSLGTKAVAEPAQERRENSVPTVVRTTREAASELSDWAEDPEEEINFSVPLDLDFVGSKPTRPDDGERVVEDAQKEHVSKDRLPAEKFAQHDAQPVEPRRMRFVDPKKTVTPSTHNSAGTGDLPAGNHSGEIVENTGAETAAEEASNLQKHGSETQQTAVLSEIGLTAEKQDSVQINSTGNNGSEKQEIKENRVSTKDVGGEDADSLLVKPAMFGSGVPDEQKEILRRKAWQRAEEKRREEDERLRLQKERSQAKLRALEEKMQEKSASTAKSVEDDVGQRKAGTDGKQNQDQSSAKELSDKSGSVKEETKRSEQVENQVSRGEESDGKNAHEIVKEIKNTNVESCDSFGSDTPAISSTHERSPLSPGSVKQILARPTSADLAPALDESKSSEATTVGSLGKELKPDDREESSLDQKSKNDVNPTNQGEAESMQFTSNAAEESHVAKRNELPSDSTATSSGRTQKQPRRKREDGQKPHINGDTTLRSKVYKTNEKGVTIITTGRGRNNATAKRGRRVAEEGSVKHNNTDKNSFKYKQATSAANSVVNLILEGVQSQVQRRSSVKKQVLNSREKGEASIEERINSTDKEREEALEAIDNNDGWKNLKGIPASNTRKAEKRRDTANDRFEDLSGQNGVAVVNAQEGIDYSAETEEWEEVKPRRNDREKPEVAVHSKDRRKTKAKVAREPVKDRPYDRFTPAAQKYSERPASKQTVRPGGRGRNMKEGDPSESADGKTMAWKQKTPQTNKPSGGLTSATSTHVDSEQDAVAPNEGRQYVEKRDMREEGNGPVLLEKSSTPKPAFAWNLKHTRDGAESNPGENSPLAPATQKQSLGSGVDAPENTNAVSVVKGPTDERGSASSAATPAAGRTKDFKDSGSTVRRGTTQEAQRPGYKEEPKRQQHNSKHEKALAGKQKRRERPASSSAKVGDNWEKVDGFAQGTKPENISGTQQGASVSTPQWQVKNVVNGPASRENFKAKPKEHFEHREASEATVMSVGIPAGSSNSESARKASNNNRNVSSVQRKPPYSVKHTADKKPGKRPNVGTDFVQGKQASSSHGTAKQVHSSTVESGTSGVTAHEVSQDAYSSVAASDEVRQDELKKVVVKKKFVRNGATAGPKPGADLHSKGKKAPPQRAPGQVSTSAQQAENSSSEEVYRKKKVGKDFTDGRGGHTEARAEVASKATGAEGLPDNSTSGKMANSEDKAPDIRSVQKATDSDVRKVQARPKPQDAVENKQSDDPAKIAEGIKKPIGRKKFANAETEVELTTGSVEPTSEKPLEDRSTVPKVRRSSPVNSKRGRAPGKYSAVDARAPHGDRKWVEKNNNKLEKVPNEGEAASSKISEWTEEKAVHSSAKSSDVATVGNSGGPSPSAAIAEPTPRAAGENVNNSRVPTPSSSPPAKANEAPSKDAIRTSTEASSTTPFPSRGRGKTNFNRGNSHRGQHRGGRGGFKAVYVPKKRPGSTTADPQTSTVSSAVENVD